MPESTTSQSPQDMFSSVHDSDQWVQENSNIVQNDTNLGWNPTPNYNIIPVATNVGNTSLMPNGANENGPIQYSMAPSYINIPYQRQVSNIQNGYRVDAPGPQTMPGVPVMVRTPQRVPNIPNTWATQQNIRLIQTAWNKTSSGGVKKQKRIRTAFTSHQMMELEQEYARTKYLDRTRRIELADILRLNERTIKIWFQNRRMKEKKDRAENSEENEDVSTTQSPPAIGVPMFVPEPYQANNEAYNRVGVFIEQYPVSSTSMAPMPQGQPASGYPTYSMPGGSPPQYHQVHLQVQNYSSPYSEMQELSPESTPQSESSASVDNTQNDAVEKNWDLSWIRSIQAEEEC